MSFSSVIVVNLPKRILVDGASSRSIVSMTMGDTSPGRSLERMQNRIKVPGCILSNYLAGRKTTSHNLHFRLLFLVGKLRAPCHSYTNDEMSPHIQCDSVFVTLPTMTCSFSLCCLLFKRGY